YQLRAQVPGGVTWFGGGSLFFAQPDMPEAELARLKSIDFALAPFKKGQWTRYTSVDGLPINIPGKIVFDADGSAWILTWAGLAHFDGSEFVNLTPEDGLPIFDGPLALYLDSKRTLWMGAGKGLWRYDPSQGVKPAQFKPPGLPESDIDIMEITGTT